MYTLLTILIIIACLLLILVVLIQNPKGGGIASNFAASNQIMGVKKTSDVVEKATWILAMVVISLSLLTNFAHNEDAGTATKNSILKDKVQDMATPPAQQPAAPQQQPNPADQQQNPNPAPQPDAQPAN